MRHDPRCIGTMGKGQRILKPAEEAVLFEHEGEGCLSHFWFGGNFQGVEDTRIRYYVDGESTPSIDLALFMGHGIGFHDPHAPWATRIIGKIGKHNGVYNNYRIPFGKHIRVTAEAAPSVEDTPQVWWIIRGVEHGRASLGRVELPDSARVKLYKTKDLEAGPLEEFDLCDVDGRGALYQVTIAAEGDSFTYLEACLRAYMNGRGQPPLMLSSGLEDYFLGTYYFDTGRYYADIAGLTHFDKINHRFSAYRFHDDDPVYFDNGLRLTCRCGETEHGLAGESEGYLDPATTRYNSYAWVYQW